MISNCDQIKSYLMVQSCDDSFDIAHNSHYVDLPKVDLS